MDEAEEADVGPHDHGHEVPIFDMLYLMAMAVWLLAKKTGKVI